MLYESQRFNTLLNQIATTLENHKDLDRLSGESFNIFRILKIQSNEVKMHSALIGDLLNVKGSHGQGKIFLDLFIQQCSNQKDHLDTSSCSIHVEHSMGSMNEDKTEGGRIDLLIRDRADKHIIIENKIYANDQENQLIRYYNKAKDVELFYLTLDGTLPHEKSCGQLEADKHFHCISYRHHIISWLENCRREVVTLPIIRETLSQYINLIKYLTNQTANQQMQKKITAIISDNLEASFTINGNLNATLDHLSEEFGNKVEAAFANTEFECTYDIDFHRNYSGIWLYRKDWKYVKIGFQFQSTNRDMVFGFTAHDDGTDNPVTIPKELKEELAKIGDGIKKDNAWWGYRQSLEQPYGDWTKYEAWEAIESGAMLDLIKDHVALLTQHVAEERLNEMMLGG